MKKTLLLSLILLTNFAFAQQSCFYDATPNNAGFSYTITVSYKRLSSWSKARPSEVYSVKLVSVTPDSRGFYYGNQRKKFYSCSEIGSNCNPNNWQQVYVEIKGQCKTASKDILSFSRINEERTIEHWIEENGTCTFNDMTGTVRQDNTRTLMNIIDTNEKATENKNTQKNTDNSNPLNKQYANNNPAVQTGATNTGTPASKTTTKSLDNYDASTGLYTNPLKYPSTGTATSKTTKTTTKPLDNYDANTGLYTNPLKSTSSGSGSSTSVNANKASEQSEQIVALATGIAGLFTPDPEKARRKAEKKAEEDKDYRNKKRDKFIDLYYNPLIKMAKNGDENARMTLYYSSSHFLSSDLVPERDDWVQKAKNNNNFDALLTEASKKFKVPISSENDLSILLNIAKLGSSDAMVILGEWFDKITYTAYGYTKFGGEDAKTALYWFEKAAEKNNPKALYYLGMIYTYGISGQSEPYNKSKKIHVKYDVVNDEQKAFNYFSKALENEDNITIFAKGSADYSGFDVGFDKGTYRELAIMYKKGKVITKDKKMGRELQNIYDNYFWLDKY
jgi:TPR repeat protein